MTDQEYGTIKIPRAEYEKHNERRKELGLSWADYISKESVTMEDPVNYAEIERRVENVVKRATR